MDVMKNNYLNVIKEIDLIDRLYMLEEITEEERNSKIEKLVDSFGFNEEDRERVLFSVIVLYLDNQMETAEDIYHTLRNHHDKDFFLFLNGTKTGVRTI